MPTPTVNTFDLSPPRRPTLADFNNAAKGDDPNHPPNVATMPNAVEWNLMAKLLVALRSGLPDRASGRSGVRVALRDLGHRAGDRREREQQRLRPDPRQRRQVLGRVRERDAAATRGVAAERIPEQRIVPDRRERDRIVRSGPGLR